MYLHLIRFFVRSDDLLNTNYGRSGIGAERPILVPSIIYTFPHAKHNHFGFCSRRSLLFEVGSVRLKLTNTYIKKSPNTAAAASTEDEVKYVYSITNSGLLTLYDISLQAESLMENDEAIDCTDTSGQHVTGSSAGRVVGLATYSEVGLAPADSIKCTATSGVSQAEVRHSEYIALTNASWSLSLIHI